MVEFKKKLVCKSDKQVSLTLVIKLFTLSTTKRSCEEKIKTLQKYSLNKKWRSGKSFFYNNYSNYNYNNNYNYYDHHWGYSGYLGYLVDLVDLVDSHDDLPTIRLW